MEENTSIPKTTLSQPKGPSLDRFIYLIIFSLLVLVLLGIVSYLYLNNRKTLAPTAKLTATSSVDKKENQGTGYVTADGGLNLRKEASSDSLVLLILPNHTEVTIITTQGDWYFVEANTKGFVSKEFISFEKPKTGLLKTFSNPDSAFSFLYPDLYTVTFAKTDTEVSYSFTGNDSYGGFKIQTEKGFVTLGNYSLKNYPQAKKETCNTTFPVVRKECEKLETDQGTLYLLLINTTLYKISYLKTDGGLLTDINNLVFSSLVLK